MSAVSPQKIKVLYNSLDMRSVSKHLAFYQLYPNSPEGMKALRHAWTLLSPPQRKIQGAGRTIPQLDSTVESIIAFVNKMPDEQSIILSEEELWVIEELANYLPNRKLKGYHAKTEEDVIKLPTEEVDLARGLFLSEMGSDEEAALKIRSYEAKIDLMALQILARLPENASPKAKIAEMNHFIFEEMGFRFPPQSLYARDIDEYTFLPSVLDSRRGVCLGVSILYLCLAQRLNLDLETITPPGHIYVRYRDGDEIINIETTARGVDVESEIYLSVGTRSLQQRTIKEVIGLAHINEAAVYWQKDEYKTALEKYLKAEKYVPGDMLLKEFMGYNYLLNGEKNKGLALLKEVNGHVPDYAVCGEILSEDLLSGNADADCICAMYMHVDETRSSVLKKKEALEIALKKYPNFRSGLFCLAATWLQLHRTGEALHYLNEYIKVRPDDPTAHYYLTIINAERLDYNQAWKHLSEAEQLVQRRDHNPKALREVRKALMHMSPEY
ncbi:MAG: transglutaminase family protein [Chlamydiota bacterium]|nr:transglutaminase family protein [Chlamydiota bacterium]